MSPLFLLLLLKLPTLITTRKVGQRWSGMSTNMTIRVLVPILKSGTINDNALTMLPPAMVDMLDLFFKPFKRYTAIENLGIKIGERLPNGSFDGLIGAQAAGKADMIFQFVDPALMDVDLGVPGHFGPIAFDGQMAILSAGQPPLEVESSLLSFLVDSVEGNLYKYILIGLIMLMIIHTMFVIACRQEQGQRRRHRQGRDVWGYPLMIANQFVTSLWLVMEVLLITESTVKPKIKIRKTASLTVVTFAFIVCVYYAMDIVLWNHLTAELSAELPSKFINGIKDLINATTSNGTLIVPILLPDLGTLAYLKSSPGQDEQDLVKYINRFDSKSAVKFQNEEYSDQLMSLIEAVSKGDAALIEKKVSFATLPLFCYHRPEMANKFHVSEETFGGGYQMFFFGPSMSVGSVKDMSFHIYNLAEMGFLMKGFHEHGQRPMVMTQSDIVPSVIAGMKCEDEVVEKVGRDPRYDPQEAVIFDLKVMKEVFLILVQGLILSSFAIIVEKGSSMLVLKRKQKWMKAAKAENSRKMFQNVRHLRDEVTKGTGSVTRRRTKSASTT